MSKTIVSLGKKGIENGYVYREREIKEYSREIDKELLRKDIPFYPVSERELVKYYMKLSQLNLSVDTNFYPLGSCTMKYNPKINEVVAGFPQFLLLHPLLPEQYVQGILKIGYMLQLYIKEITKLPYVTIQPAAGAHGELTGLFMITKKLRLENKSDREIVLIPDSAHGTNPASAAFLGYKVITVTTSRCGSIELSDFEKKCTEKVAALMVTIPNTLGIFENNILKISEIIHKVGGYIYMDGANFNALIGHINASALGIDILHLNLHKTFSVPHGSGGPGSGVIAVNENFKDFLPVPIIDFKDNKYYLNFNIKNTIGPIKLFWGHTNHWIRALSYIFKYGSEMYKISETACLNTRYLYKKLSKLFPTKYTGLPLHEFVVSAKNLKKYGVRALDVAKRMIDHGIHPPTMYFPLIVEEALMIEPTETESIDTLNEFVDIMKKIIEESKKNSDIVEKAPINAPIKRVDEVRAARNLTIVE
ncbi:MAG: aminomethyl-transferring glycine dehydrogenase subunit GcvPB [Planctomycetota bacterium]